MFIKAWWSGLGNGFEKVNELILMNTCSLTSHGILFAVIAGKKTVQGHLAPLSKYQNIIGGWGGTIILDGPHPINLNVASLS